MSSGFLIDTNQCVGCRSCEIACKAEYQLQAGQGRRRRVIEKTSVEGSDVRTFFISLACNQCANPACVKACPKSLAAGTGTASNSALWKDTTGAGSAGLIGVVHYEPAHCIGCRRCEWACPYGAPQFDPDAGYIHKCEMCWQRLAAWKADWGTGSDPYNPPSGAARADKRRNPACVANCIGRAIHAADVPTDASVVAITGGVYAHDDFDDQVGLRNFYAAGTTGNGNNDRGAKYLASNALTNPAVRVCNRVYKDRNGVAT